MALVFSPEEVGLYDFHTDLLLAKYVASFCPDFIIATDNGGRLEFSTDREMLQNRDWAFELVNEGAN